MGEQNTSDNHGLWDTENNFIKVEWRVDSTIKGKSKMPQLGKIRLNLYVRTNRRKPRQLQNNSYYQESKFKTQ